MKKSGWFILVLLAWALSVSAQQQTGEVYGTVYNEDGEPQELVNVAVIGMPEGTSTDKEGTYRMHIPANSMINLAFSFQGYRREVLMVQLEPDQHQELNVHLKPIESQLPTFEVVTQRPQREGVESIPVKVAAEIPTASGSAIEELVKRTGLGVSATSELTSQYSVRGGNYDENLVYVNNIQIYRPFLISSGEQEGLSFLNPNLVESVNFSSGGFDARYGDKMSSVLDITYKDPVAFEAGFEGSLLGGSVYAQDVSKRKTLSYVAGLRYKTNRYLLNAMQTSGEYQPAFMDFQTLIRWKASPVFHISLLGSVSDNRYEMIPESRETRFGTLNEALRFRVFFDGKESDRFRAYNTALTFHFEPSKHLNLDLIASAYLADEWETYDIRGQYWLEELETDLGADDFGSAALTRGVGSYLEHARNLLTAHVISLKHVGDYTRPAQNLALHWGLEVQKETIDDEMWEWTMLDSAGYALPRPPDSIGYQPPYSPKRELKMHEFVSSQAQLQSLRTSGHIQNSWLFNTDSMKYELTTGLRFQHWSLNQELLISPRAALVINPLWKRDVSYRLAAGVYYQPPFFREMRAFDGTINTNLKAQRSIHLVAGQYWNFQAWGRPFRFVTEAYYKKLDNLVPYEIDNVSIRYFAQNNAEGYATGVDMKVNGEFVKGLQSYAGLSIMKTKEDILDDYYYLYYNDKGEQIIPGFTTNDVPVDSSRHEPGLIPRPSDRRVNFSLFFQDFLPGNPTYKMHLNLVYGTGLPFGPPTRERYKDTLRMPPYQRVDIGFSKQLKGKNQQVGQKNPLRHFQSAWISLEVFNLLQNNNTISYMWISDVHNRQYAIPRYLTSRRVNLRLVATF